MEIRNGCSGVVSRGGEKQPGWLCEQRNKKDRAWFPQEANTGRKKGKRVGPEEPERS
jgi:hypothetical protein